MQVQRLQRREGGLLLVALLVARADDAFQSKNFMERNGEIDVEEA